ncbi:MAG: FAD-dependent monooxygenase [Pseudomonadales bacterium]
MKHNYDIVICGGGMIGAALATQLAPHGFSIALVEAQAPAAYDLSQSFDLRISALSPKSAQVMQQSKAWDILQDMRLCPYKRMRVWEIAGFGDLTFNASQTGVSELGHIVENRLVQLSLWQALEESDNVDVICPASPTTFQRGNSATRIVLDTGQSLSARLVVGADGAQSKVRQGFGVGVNRGQYQQACLVASVNTQLGQQDITWQRFVNTGPQAFLPLLGQHGSVVWYHQADQARALSKLSHGDLADEIMAQFPPQLGNIEVTAKASFGLQKQHAQSYFTHGMVLVGDAAHVINPLAGQGVNLGFQDVSCLAKVLTDAHNKGEDWCSVSVLNRYQKKRKLANSLMLQSMDAFHHGFSQTNSSAKWLRNLVLASANLPLIKKRVVRYAMGM